MRVIAEKVIVDGSAMVDLLVASPSATALRIRLRGHELHAPAYFDVEVLSALGRLHRGGHLTARQATTRIQRMATAPIQRHLLPPLLTDAWLASASQAAEHITPIR